jgi:hypothetical protein
MYSASTIELARRNGVSGTEIIETGATTLSATPSGGSNFIWTSMWRLSLGGKTAPAMGPA